MNDDDDITPGRGSRRETTDPNHARGRRRPLSAEAELEERMGQAIARSLGLIEGERTGTEGRKKHEDPDKADRDQGAE